VSVGAQAPPITGTESRSMLRGPLYISLALFALCLVLGAIWGGYLRIPGHVIGARFEIAAALLGVWLLGLIGFWAKRHKRFDPFEPPIWISLNIYFQIVMNVWLLQRDRVPWIPWLRSNYSTSMPLAVILFGITLTFFWSGYAVAYGRLARISSGKKTGDLAVKLSNTYILWFLIWVVEIYASLVGISSYLGSGISSSLSLINYYQFVLYLGSAVTAIIVIRHFKHPTTAGWIWLATIVVVQLILSLVVGSKGFATFFIWLIMCYYYSKRRLPKFFLVFAAAAVICFVPVVNSFRVALHGIDSGGGVSLMPRAKALSGVITAISHASFQNLFDSTRQTFETRQGDMLDVTASVLTLHPKKMPYVGEEMISDFFREVVPRVFWPGKPVERSRLDMISTVYCGTHAEYAFTSIGLPADAYRAGGWAFVIFFFFILGAFMAWLYVRGPFRGSLFGIVLYVTLLFNILVYDRSIKGILINLIQFGLLIWIITKWGLFRRADFWNSIHK